LSTSSNRPSSLDIDEEVRRAVGKEASSSSFEYHVMKLVVLIDRNVQDKELYKDMVNELILAIEDLRTWVHRL